MRNAVQRVDDIRRARIDHADKRWLAGATESDAEAMDRMRALVQIALMAVITLGLTVAAVLITDVWLDTGYVAEAIAGARGDAR